MAENEKEKFILCPYCGHMQPGEDSQRCDECGGLFEPLSRRATQIAMGPWFIRDTQKPFRPGCSYDVLAKQVKAGRIKPTTVIRGPTTRQFWSVARNVPGLAHLLGYCHRCGEHVEASDPSCPHCGEPFMAVRDRNELGLLYPTEKEAAAASRALERERQGLPAKPEKSERRKHQKERKSEPAEEKVEAAPVGAGMTAVTAGAGGGDLLSQVLGPAVASGGGTGTDKSAARSPLLSFDQPSEKQVVEPPTPEPLDFTPTDEEEGEAVASTGPGLMTWLLIIVNLIALAAVAAFIWYYTSQSNADTSGNNSDAGNAVVSTYDEQNDDDRPRQRPAQNPPPSEPEPTTPTSGGNADRSVSTGDAEAADTNATSGETGKPVPRSPREKYEESFQRALEHEQKGEFDSAISILEQIRDDSDDPAVDAEANAAIVRVQTLKEETGNGQNFFGLPMNGQDE